MKMLKSKGFLRKRALCITSNNNINDTILHTLAKNKEVLKVNEI